MKRVLNDLKL